MARTVTTSTLLCVFLVVLLVSTPCYAARTLRDSDRSLAAEDYELERRASNWSEQASGDDSVPTSSNASKHRKWVRYQEQLMFLQNDYGEIVAAANPSPVYDPTYP